MNPTNPDQAPTARQADPGEPPVQSLLRQVARGEADRLAEDEGFTAALMLRLAREERRHAEQRVAAKPAAAPQVRAAKGTPAPDRPGWIEPSVWMVLPVGLLLGLGVWVSASLIGAPVGVTVWAAAASADEPDAILRALEAAGGSAIAAWTAWLSWQSRHWLLDDPADFAEPDSIS